MPAGLFEEERILFVGRIFRKAGGEIRGFVVLSWRAYLALCNWHGVSAGGWRELGEDREGAR